MKEPCFVVGFNTEQSLIISSDQWQRLFPRVDAVLDTVCNHIGAKCERLKNGDGAVYAFVAHFGFKVNITWAQKFKAMFYAVQPYDVDLNPEGIPDGLV